MAITKRSDLNRPVNQTEWDNNWQHVKDLSDTDTDDGTKGFHLVHYPPLSGETGVVNYEYPVGDVRRYGATGDGITDDTVSLRAWATVGGDLVLPAGTYLFDNTTTGLTEFPSNTNVVLSPSAKIKFTAQGNAGIVITSKSNIDLTGGLIEGLPGTTTGSEGFSINSSNNINLSGVDVSQFNGIGAYFTSCTRCSATKIKSHNNSVYGIQDKIGKNNNISDNWLYSNGSTTSGANVIGRGLVTWMVEDGTYSNNQCYSNTEYGLRLYSESGDASGTENNTYAHNRVYDNGNSGNTEFYIYNDGGSIKNNIIHANIITMDAVKTTIGMSVQGDENTITDNQIINSADNQVGSAYQLFNCLNSTISGGIVKGVGSAVSFSGTANAIPDGMTISGIKAYNVASFIPSITYFGTGAKGHTIRDNEATHGGGGTDVGIVITNWTEGQLEVHNNHLDGFDKGITIGSTAINLSGNSTTNSTTWGCEVLVTTSDNVEFFGNRWDKAFPASKANMSVGRIGGAGSRITSSNTIPTGDSRLSPWLDGDFCHRKTIAVDGNGRIPIGWVCTVSGTAGTWETVFISSATWV